MVLHLMPPLTIIAAFVGEVIFEEGSEVLIITSRMEGREVQLLQTTDQIDGMLNLMFLFYNWIISHGWPISLF